MAAPQSPTALSLNEIGGWFRRSEVIMALGVLLIIVIFIVPVPAMILDILLAISIISSILILMTGLMIKRPLDFGAFPTVLLVTTLYRLALNITSMRMILSHGHNGEQAAGAIIHAFGSIMTEGNFIIGLILFAMFVLVNFIVITKGAGRIAEVSARFTLDSMPGKQMAIDADLSSGLIDADEAKQRRKEVEMESGFFGAMDGASKFVRGDAIAGIIITLVNIIGGIIIGITVHGMPAGEAAQTYILLTIGDGLVTQLPAFIISIAAAFLVSKAGIEGAADKALMEQLATNPIALGMASGASFLLALVPDMPWFFFIVISALTGVFAWRLGRPKAKGDVDNLPLKPSEAEEEPISATLAIDDLKIELGLSLLALINDLDGRKLTDQIKALRRNMATEYGFVIPSVRILDNMRLGHSHYCVRIKEMEAGAGEVKIGSLMAMDPTGRQVELPGEHTKEPAFGLPATWIDQSLREEATFLGYTIVDPATVITTHLTEIIKDNMSDLLSYAMVAKMLREAPDDNKKLIEETIPNVVNVATLQRVLQALLKERVSIRDLPAILEGLGEAGPQTKSITQMVEHVRSRLGRQLCWVNRAGDGSLPIITLSHEWESAFASSIIGQGDERQLTMAPSALQEFIRNVRDVFERASMNGDMAVLLTSPGIRPFVRSIIERFRANTTVMSQNEIHPKVKLKTVGQV
jgi:flagellar biosynthesis protein FlhA